MPAICFEGSTPAQAVKDEDTAVSQINLADKEVPSVDDLEDDYAESPVAAPQFESVQARLIGTINRESIDQIAVDFALINAKGTRKRLIKVMLLQARSRADLIPYFGRMLASLNPYISEVPTSIIQSVRLIFCLIILARSKFPQVPKRISSINRRKTLGMLPLCSHLLYRTYDLWLNCANSKSHPSI